MSVGINKNFIGVNLVPQNTTPNSENGDLRYNSTTDKYETFSGVTDSIVTEADTATLTNKTIDANSNTIENLTNSNLNGSAAITNANLAAMPAGTVKANLTGSSALPSDDTAQAVVIAGGGVIEVGTIDSEVTPSSDGASIISNAILMQSASATVPGLVNTTAQIFSGDKTFTGNISAANLSGTNTGDQTITLTGDVAGSGTGSFATTIQSNVVDNTKLAQMPSDTIKGNNTGSTADAMDLSISQLQSMLTIPTGGAPLPISSGGTGQITQQAAIDALTGTQAAGTFLRSNGTHSSLSLIQVSDVPTLNQNTTGTASNITGTAAIANGGTGQITANAALNALLPTQTGNAGKTLFTNGTNTSWVATGGSGTVTNKCHYTNNAITSSFTASSVIPFDTADFESPGGSFNFTTNTYTAPTAGIYVISIRCCFVWTSTTVKEGNITMSKNGGASIVGTTPFLIPASGSGTFSSFTCSETISLAANDTLTFQVNTSTTGNSFAIPSPASQTLSIYSLGT